MSRCPYCGCDSDYRENQNTKDGAAETFVPKAKASAAQDDGSWALVLLFIAGLAVVLASFMVSAFLK